MGHEWTINGKKVKAKVVDFNATHVLLEIKDGKRKSVAINTLESKDLQYLTNLATIRNGEVQRRLEASQLEQQRLQLLSQYSDVWTVSMIAPNGRLGWRNYFAVNSMQANQLALREFPNVRIVRTQRLRRATEFGGARNAVQVPLGLQTNFWWPF